MCLPYMKWLETSYFNGLHGGGIFFHSSKRRRAKKKTYFQWGGEISGLAAYSLCWDDRLRLELGHPLTIPYNEAPDVSSRELGDLPSVYGATLPPDIASARLQENAKRLLDSLRKAIPLGTEESTYATREARKPLARHMIGVLQPDADQVSSVIVLLAQWTVHLLFQKAHGKRHCLRLSSVRRYLASFSKVFIQFCYAMDLANAEPEQVTDFYRRILSTGKRREQAYRAKRLPVFHAWARGEGIAEPEWGELPKLPAVVEVAPGLISETEYLEIFQRLQNQAEVPHHLMDIQAFIWLCAYRYGLREHEAFYLRASDRLCPGNRVALSCWCATTACAASKRIPPVGRCRAWMHYHRESWNCSNVCCPQTVSTMTGKRRPMSSRRTGGNSAGGYAPAFWPRSRP